MTGRARVGGRRNQRNGTERVERRSRRDRGAATRKPDLLMSVEIPRGSLGVPKHQRDCVPPAKVFHYRGERVPSFLSHPPQTFGIEPRHPRAAFTLVAGRASTCKPIFLPFCPSDIVADATTAVDELPHSHRQSETEILV